MKTPMRFMVAGLCLVAGAAFGAEYALKSGTTDWTKADSYEPAGVPGADDTVILPSETFEVDSSSASFATLSGVKRLVPDAGTRLVITVDEGEKTLGCAFNYAGENGDGATIGELVKKGTGTLKLGSPCWVLNPGGYAYDYCTRLTLEEGKLSLMQEPETFGSGQRVHYGCIATSNGTELTVSVPPARTSGRGMEVEWLDFGGLVINEHATASRVIYVGSRQSEGVSKVDGAINGKIRMWVSGNIDLNGTGSTFSEDVTATGWQEESSFSKGSVGVADFGMQADAASSVGTNPELVSSNGGGGFRYTGSASAVTDRAISAFDSTFLDGGDFGGIEFAGLVYSKCDNASNEGQHRLFLFGDNASAPCTFSGGVYGWNNYAKTLPTSDYYSFYVIKRGTGTWRFAGTKFGGGYVGWNGGLAVEEGTFQFDSIAPVGVDCSLGTALKMTDGTAGPWSDEHMTDYAIALGSANPAAPAVFEYVGTGPALCSTRPLALVGVGGALRADGGWLDFSGISARDADSSPMLTLTGTNTAGNVVREISAGAEGATVGVVKEGSGTWSVGGNFKIDGGVKVKEGTLSLDVPHKRLPPVYKDYKWFRLSFAEIADGSGGTINRIELRQIALFDKDGIRQNVGLTVPEGAFDPTTKLVQETEIAAGEAAYDASMAGMKLSGEYAPPDGLQSCFNGKYSGYNPYYTPAPTTTPDKDKPASWLKIVMHLPDSANPITHFDVEGFQGSCKYVPQRLKMEASVDGQGWTEVFNNVTNENPHTYEKQATYNVWISDGVVATADNRELGKGFTLSASGEMVEQEKKKPFNWFRLSIAEIEGGSSTLYLRQIGLYDKDGNRQNSGLTLAEDIVPQDNVVRTIAAAEIGPGEVGYDLSVTGFKLTPHRNKDGCAIDLPAAFNNAVGGDDGRYNIDWRDTKGISLVPTLSKPETWIPIVMHLADGSKPVTHFDIQAFYYSGANRRIPSRLKMEGSTDGKTWTELWSNLKEGDPAINPTLTYYNHWISCDGADAMEHPEGTGFALSKCYPDQVEYDQKLAGDIQVANGAKLAATNPMELDSLTIDTEGAGTYSGFAFAETGTLNVLNPKRDGSFLPGTFENCTGLENLVNWSVKLDGTAKPAYKIEVTADGKVRLVSPGMLLILR